MQDTFVRARTQPVGQARATIGYLVYNQNGSNYYIYKYISLSNLPIFGKNLYPGDCAPDEIMKIISELKKVKLVSYEIPNIDIRCIPLIGWRALRARILVCHVFQTNTCN